MASKAEIEMAKVVMVLVNATFMNNVPGDAYYSIDLGEVQALSEAEPDGE